MDSPTQSSSPPDIQPFSRPGEEGGSRKRMVAIAGAAMLILLGAVFLVFRDAPKKASGPRPYAANIKLSDFKMSAAENFVGATVSYVDGTVTNTGSQMVTHVEADVVFKDDLGQVVQNEAVALKVLRTSGPYPEAVDLRSAPLGRGQSQPFRLTFESISSQWNHQYPEIRISDVSVAAQ
jgi:hypothetical protein